VRLHVIGGRDLVLGFRLAGCSGDVVGAEDDAAEAVRRAAADPEVGILLVSTTAAQDARAALDAVRVRRAYPIIFEIPEPGGPPRDPDALMRFVAEAVGLRL
jgi:V/A-type H+-transporting ATPase subunit F